MSEHPDMANLRTLGDQWYDPSSEPGRWTRYTVTTDNNQALGVSLAALLTRDTHCCNGVYSSGTNVYLVRHRYPKEYTPLH
eukprot:scaffold170686_cov23-Tisochrysis_lutea.AAC.1